jgi:hypothetical protein
MELWSKNEEKGGDLSTSSYKSRGVVLATAFWLPPPLLRWEFHTKVAKTPSALIALGETRTSEGRSQQYKDSS